MQFNKRKIIGLLATTAAIAAGPAAGSAMADFSVSDASTTEGGDLAFTVTATCQLPFRLPCVDERFEYSVSGNGAQQGSDFPEASGAFLLSTSPLNQTEVRTITVPTTDDATDEPDEEGVIFHLSHHNNMGNADREASGTIRDNDAEPNINSVTGPTTVTEGTGGSRSTPVTVHLSAASEKTITRSFHTTDGTATSPADFTSTSGNAEFAPGETEKTINVPIVTDSVDESDEGFSFETGNAGLAIKILDDDEAQTPPPGNGGQNPPGNGQNPPPGNGGQNPPANNGGQQQNPVPQVVYVPQPSTQNASSTPTAPKAKAKAKVKKCKKGSVRKGKGSKAKCVKKKKSAKKARR